MATATSAASATEVGPQIDTEGVASGASGQVQGDARARQPSRPTSRASIRNLFSRSRGNSHSSNREGAESVATEDSMEAMIQNLRGENRRKFLETSSHPIGAILIHLYKDNLNLSQRTGLREMSTTLLDLCNNFSDHMCMERDRARGEIDSAVQRVESNLVTRELNSHLLSQDFKAPTNFALGPTLLTPSMRAEAMKLFPLRGNKFSGNKEGASVVEFLSNMRSGQLQTGLSEKEFLEFMLLATTGPAHVLLSDWVDQQYDVPTIFHNFLIYYDKRLAPEEARQLLQNLKAYSGSNLSKLMARILNLASRSSSLLPAGPAQRANFDLEATSALIRALPPSSANLAQNQFNLLSAKLGRNATYTELCKSLNLYRGQVDQDIRRNGQDNNSKFKGNGGKNKDRKAFRERSGDYEYTTNAMELSGTKGRDGKKEGKEGYGAKVSKPHYSKGRGNYKANSSQSGRKSYCSLCGKADHQATDGCPYMQADNGKVIKVLPTLGACTQCPPHVQPRLNHPIMVCPYRKGGPWGKH